ncbi:uncharacterized protein N7529_005595 [Penicillium soppii]|uniref:uncharacterized protein n=1 Tax=Penicillium soppii TaxID=69789 RepID=UPI002548451A|nr:uncharacterized protein N7529_005595 [Penicillium soppii]KAJ5863679.1 hypothetical protein N7529_005595 [Penicillium soppii]
MARTERSFTVVVADHESKENKHQPEGKTGEAWRSRRVLKNAAQIALEGPTDRNNRNGALTGS